MYLVSNSVSMFPGRGCGIRIRDRFKCKVYKTGIRSLIQLPGLILNTWKINPSFLTLIIQITH